MKRLIFLIMMLLAGCASGPEYCIVTMENGKQEWRFSPSRSQTMDFERKPEWTYFDKK